MEKKMKLNFILKGIAVFAFVAFCLLAILAGVTLPFVSNASTSDSAFASADSTINLDNFTITLSNCNTTDTYYGFYITEVFYNFVKNYTFESGVPVFFGSGAFGDTSFLIYCGRVDNADNTLKFNTFAYTYDFDNNHFLMQSDIPYSATNRVVLFNQGFNFVNIYSDNQADEEHIPAGFKDKIKVFTSLPFGGDTTELENQIATLTAEKNALQTQVNNLTADKAALQVQLTEKQNQIDTLTAEKNALQNQLSNMNFMSHFGNFDNLGSSDFYVNLSSDIVLPEIFYQFTNNSTPINGWFLMGSGANTEIYGLNLFDRFYYNGTQESGFLNCGFQLTIKSVPSTSIPPTYTTVGKLHFVVSDTFVWSADCDYDYNTDTKVESITNIRNGSFKVSSNYDKDTNVYKFTAPSDKLYLLNENYNKSYDIFRSYVVQQDYKKTRVPSDNALYLKGYQAASGEFYNNGYNDGVAAGEKSGYNKGFTAGDAQGYNRGVEVGGNYSFLGLFGAIFDAPIQAIFGGTTTLPAGTTITDKNGNTTTLLSSATVHRAGLLNFEVMGVNLSGFVLALFSISIIVVVIKFALAKK